MGSTAREVVRLCLFSISRHPLDLQAENSFYLRVDFRVLCEDLRTLGMNLGLRMGRDREGEWTVKMSVVSAGEIGWRSSTKCNRLC